MRIAILLSTLLASSVFAGTTYVAPHVRSNGTVVQGHYRTTPDSNPYNNYSSQGNYNPYTGQQGTVNPYQQYQPQYQPQPVQPNLYQLNRQNKF